MNWLLIRTDGALVARSGNAGSYTRDVRQAQRFASEEEARRNSCVENERPVRLEAWLGS